MNPRRARNILNNDNELNIAQLAEAHAEQNKRADKRKRIPSVRRAVRAYRNLKAQEQAREVWRQKVATIWKRNPK